MLKKTLFVSLAALALSTPAMAIEMPEDATVTFENESTAYPSYKFNQIMEAYGIELMPEYAGMVPKTYAKVGDGEAVFNDDNIAYPPTYYHNIFTAYGLELLPENAREILEVPSYARVVGDEVIFGDSVSIAYDGWAWQNILSAYTLIDSDGDGVPDIRDDCPNTPKGVQVNERGCWEYDTGLLFDFDKYDIKPEYFSVLDDTKRIFDLNPGLKLTVEGHTDSIGAETYNQGLSERRANSVMNYLIQNVGIDPASLDSVGYGETQPAYPNDTAEGRARNRRAQFTSNMQ
ncbi:OmpA family protein [Desulfosediminicola ganghwensis]|uniref:OmpA family protein n=1 Tax=Desulfosediminicola ganghwensis TaxID=2569540 RepID=UPI0010ACCC6E|nr:OmpA family protein [Desulfosediminicola ganghwensis]